MKKLACLLTKLKTNRLLKPAVISAIAVLPLCTFTTIAAAATHPGKATRLSKSVTAVHPSVAPNITWPAPTWQDSLVTGGSVGYVAQSSPSVAYYRGKTIVAVGAENGYVYLVDGVTGKEMPGWPQRLAAGPGQSVAVESSPTIAWLNGKKSPPTIIVTSGSPWVTDTVGEVEAFTITGKRRWVFSLPGVRGTAIGAISSPAVGDILGNNQQQIVFGSWDHKIYVLNARGQELGFAYDNADTVWSSPVLYKLPHQKADSVFLGSDASGRTYDNGTKKCFGGFVAEYKWSNAAQNPDTEAIGPGLDRVWFDCMSQSIWSSPSIGILNHVPTLVVGTSWYEQPFPSDTNYVFAFNAISGQELWQARTAGPAAGSPAIGVINSTGQPSVVETSWACNGSSEQSCFYNNSSMVYAFNSHGKQEWAKSLVGPTDLSSPVLVPLAGEKWNDVLVGSPNGLYPISGATGNFLFGTSDASSPAVINYGCRVYNSVAVANVGASITTPDWEVFEACGGPEAFHKTGQLIAYKITNLPAGEAPGWAMFHADPAHTGVGYSTLPGRHTPPGLRPALKK